MSIFASWDKDTPAYTQYTLLCAHTRACVHVCICVCVCVCLCVCIVCIAYSWPINKLHILYVGKSCFTVGR